VIDGSASPGGDVGARGSWLVDADLDIVVDGTGGRAVGRLSSVDGRLRLEVDRPHVVLATISRPTAAALADRMAAAGIPVEVHGPSGRIGTVDPHRSSRIGSLLTGSPHVALDPSGWRTLARAGARTAGSALRWTVGLGAVAAVVVAWYRTGGGRG
jgi:hypothetical protein